MQPYMYSTNIYVIVNHFFADIPEITSVLCTQPVISGHTAECHCHANAKPGANISWFRHGSLVKGPRSTFTNHRNCDGNNSENCCMSYSVLTILNTKWTDHGVHVCSAQNRYYQVKQPVNLIVEGELANYLIVLMIATYLYVADHVILCTHLNLMQNIFSVKKVWPSKVESYLEVNA